VRRLPTRLDGPILLEPTVHRDGRGFFAETYRASALASLGIRDDFVQDNHSRSTRGVIRGMHFQVDPPAAKLVRCARGAVVDVLVDIRPGSASYGEWEAYELSDENLRVLYAPVGFAHGFAVISDVADVLYKQSAEWSPSADRGFNPEDPQVAIEWPISPAERTLSDRDRAAPALAELTSPAAPSPAGSS
jgi:dTDP-4-dehydrorhamnose 3,5-epimerase